MITSELFGTAPCGTPVHRYTLNGPEICVRIMDYGATVLGIDVPDIPGNVRDVVLGFDKLEDYFDNPACFGATIGPVANRTAGATITIAGTDWHMPANEGANNLHSDLEHGLHKRVWDVELDETHNAVRMTTSLEDGELGLPGNRTFTAVFTVTRTGVFRIEYGCESDRATYVSMTNHTYFNLAGHNAGMDCEHFFVANAAHYLPINDQNIPTGEIAPVEGCAPSRLAWRPTIRRLSRPVATTTACASMATSTVETCATRCTSRRCGPAVSWTTTPPPRACSSTPATGWATSTPRTMPTMAGAPALPSRQRCTPTRRTSRCSRRALWARVTPTAM